MDAFDILSLIISCIWMPVSINILITRRLGLKRRVICAIIIAIAFSTTLIAQYSEISGIWVFPICLLIVYWGMGKSKSQLLYVPIAYIIVVTCNYITEYLFECVNISNEQIKKEILIMCLFFTVITIMVILFSYLVKKYIIFYANAIYGAISKEISILIVCDIILCAAVYLVNGWSIRKMGYPEETKKITMVIFLIYTVITIGFTIIAFRIAKSQEKIHKEKEEKKNLLEYTRQVETMYEELRSFKHDYINILLSLSGYIKNGDMTELEKYFEQNILPTSERINQGKYHLQKLSKICETAIKGLVSSKMIYAMNMGIDVFIDIVDNVEYIAIKTLDLVQVLGIYIDNAIEASLESKQKELKFNIVKDDGSVTIIIMNSYVNHNMSVKEMEKQNISTKGEGRGLGLSNVNDILGKYSNVNKMTEMNEQYFIQTLVIEEALK